MFYPGPCDQSGPQSVIADDGDRWLVAVEGDIAFTADQTEDAHGAILVTHGDVDAIRGRAEEGHFVFGSL